MVDTKHYPPSRKYDVNEEYADAARALTKAWHDLYAALDTTPTWQTKPPTEAGWYPAIDQDGRMIAYEVTLFEAHGGIMKYHNPVTISKFLKWWPIPITMPEPPEGGIGG